MKIIVHRTQIPAKAPFSLSAVKEHLRVDFGDDDLAIHNIAHTAAEELEQFAQIALLTQTIRVTIFDPVCGQSGLKLPIGPVADTEVPTITIDGTPFTEFDFAPGNRPYIRWLAAFHTLTPSRISIQYQAGFGDDADSIPRDLAQALKDQAALHYDGRSPMEAKSLTTSPHMVRVGAKYRGVQL